MTHVDLEEFIKLYVNHRPAFGISSDEFGEVFRVLGDCDSRGQHVLQTHKFLELLKDQGTLGAIFIVREAQNKNTHKCVMFGRRTHDRGRGGRVLHDTFRPQ